MKKAPAKREPFERDAGVPYRGVPASRAHMLTATTEVEAPLSVAGYSYITPRGVFQDGGGWPVRVGVRSSLNSSIDHYRTMNASSDRLQASLGAM